MNRERTSAAAASCSAVPDTYTTTYETTDVGEPSRPYRMEPDTASPCRHKYESINSIEVSDWLTEATVDLGRDLDTSKKELDIIKFILEEMELRSRTDLPRVFQFPMPCATRTTPSNPVMGAFENDGTTGAWNGSRRGQIVLFYSFAPKAPTEESLSLAMNSPSRSSPRHQSIMADADCYCESGVSQILNGKDG
ncbi:hypothetical protein F4801DRAFT_585257 [Xylaria longipes]|nr:hypothetical protein F4801DRAFT_585257 [Xylaria longipes]